MDYVENSLNEKIKITFAHSHHSHSHHFDFPYFSSIFLMTGTGMMGMELFTIEKF
jgi:hypothetical protein